MNFVLFTIFKKIFSLYLIIYTKKQGQARDDHKKSTTEVLLSILCYKVYSSNLISLRGQLIIYEAKSKYSQH